MKQELVRINSIDGIEQPGILYTPNEYTNKIVIHVHGLNGNFYENRFLVFVLIIFELYNFVRQLSINKLNCLNE